MTNEKLYPLRQRCKTCNKGFPERGAIMGLYCTYRCAGMAEPFKNPQDAPRWCVTEREGALQWKKRMRHEGEFPMALRDDPSAQSYYCRHCGFLHIGHSRVELEVEKTRMLKDQASVADVLTKARLSRGWTLKDAAAKAGIRPIRVKEWEAGSEQATVAALFALGGVYGIKWAAIFR